jgi:hypothetical protein
MENPAAMATQLVAEAAASPCANAGMANDSNDMAIKN